MKIYLVCPVFHFRVLGFRCVRHLNFNHRDVALVLLFPNAMLDGFNLKSEFGVPDLWTRTLLVWACISVGVQQDQFSYNDSPATTHECICI